MLNDYPVLQDLPPETRAEIERIIKIPSGQRNSGETAFLNARSSYLGFDSSNNLIRKSGMDVPAPGSTGYGQGGIFQKVDFFGRVQEIYQNTGTETNANFAFVGRNTGYRVTVSLNGTGDFNCAPGKYNHDVQINKAITLIYALSVNGLGGGSVELISAGIYWISEPVQIRPNISLFGLGCGASYFDNGVFVDVPGKTTIKARDNYAPTVLNILGGYSMLLSYNDEDIKNNEIAGITWDANAQNWGTPSVGVANARHRTIWPRKMNGMYFHHNEVKNSWNWNCYFHLGRNIKVMHNNITGGWEVNDTSKYVSGRQDGIDVKGQDIWVMYNSIDTYGVQTTGGQSSGDDGIQIRQDGTGDGGSQRVYVGYNVIKSGSRAIGCEMNGGDADNTDIHIFHNTILKSSKSGIYILRHGASETTKFRRIYITENTIYSSGNGEGDASSQDSCGIGLDVDENSASGFEDVFIERNTIVEALRPKSSSITFDGWGIAVLGKGENLHVDKNDVTGVAGTTGIGINTGTYQVSNFSCDKNTVVQTSSNNIFGIVSADNKQGSISGNTCIGLSTASSRGIKIVGYNSGGAQFITSVDNRVENYSVGILEQNAGVDPDNNRYSNNTFVNCNYILIGTNSNVTDTNYRYVLAKTADVTLGAKGGGNLFTNEGATSLVTITLPSAAAGMRHSFYCQDTDGIKVKAATGDTK